MNVVILTGRLTRDPESKVTQNNMEISRFSLACDYGYTKDGKLTEFVNCVAFGKTAETINKYCKKGAMIVAVGRIKNSSYDAQDGTKRYTTDVLIKTIEFLESKSKDNRPEPNNLSTPVSQTSVAEQVAEENDPYKDFGDEFTLSADDLPF